MGRVNERFVARNSRMGWGGMGEIIDAYPPARRIAEITGLPVDDIIAGAKILADCPRWMSLWTMGLNQSARGTWNVNAICNLHLATGQIGLPGSGPFSLTGQPNAMGGREVGYMSSGLPGLRSVHSPRDRAETEGSVGHPGGEHPPAPRAPGHRPFPCDGSAARSRPSVDHRQQPGGDHCPTGTACGAVWSGRSSSSYRTPTTRRKPRAYAHVLLPGAVWAEADGTMTNSSRMVTLTPRAVLPPVDAKPDWWLICEVARRLGFRGGVSLSERGGNLRRSARQRQRAQRLRPARDQPRTAGPEGALTWPLSPAGGATSVPRRYVTPDGALRFPTETGRARFWARPYLPNAEMPDDEFPFVLLTGRVPHQWHTRTKTGKVPSLNKLNPAPYLEIHPEDAAALGVADGDRLRIASRRGELQLPARLTADIQPGCCWAPMHWTDLFAADVAVNAVTSENACPESHQPELKYCPVQLTVVRPVEPHPATAAIHSTP